MGCAMGSCSESANPVKYGSVNALNYINIVHQYWAEQIIQDLENISLSWLCITSAAVGRSFGSKASRRLSKWRAIGSIPGNFCVKGTGGFFLMLAKYRRAFSFRIYKKWQGILFII